MGPLKTLPYLVMFLMSNAGGWAGDALILKQHRSVAAARKAVNTLGEAGHREHSNGACRVWLCWRPAWVHTCLVVAGTWSVAPGACPPDRCCWCVCTVSGTLGDM